MEKKLYTIGHSQHDLNYFLKLLRYYEINYVLDVRSTPYSKYATDYNKEKINDYLKMQGINYCFMGNFFGARQEDRTLYSAEGHLDFEKVRQGHLFVSALDNVIKGIGSGNKITLMCTEKDPIECHRAIMVAKGFHDSGISVQHILSTGELQSHAELEERLLDMYFPNRNQISLFENKDIKEYIRLAYIEQNKKIGYHIDNIGLMTKYAI